MERHILVPLDGSALAETVLPHALMLARTNGSSLHLIRVVTPNVAVQAYTWPLAAPDGLHVTLELAQSEAQAYLEGIAQRLQKHDPKISWSVEAGDPAQVILDYAHDHPRIGEIALSTHGRSGIKRWLLGSVAEKLIQVAPVPMLIVPATTITWSPGAAYHSILVPLDGSSFAAQALGLAQCIADWYGATLHLMTAVDPLHNVPVSDTNVVPLWELRERTHAQRRAIEYLEQEADVLRQRGFMVETHLSQDPPAESIIGLTEQIAPDLVVMTTHGRSGLQRLWMGSVATRVIRNNSRPVLLARGYTSTEIAQERAKSETIVQTS